MTHFNITKNISISRKHQQHLQVNHKCKRLTFEFEAKHQIDKRFHFYWQGANLKKARPNDAVLITNKLRRYFYKSIN